MAKKKTQKKPARKKPPVQVVVVHKDTPVRMAFTFTLGDVMMAGGRDQLRDFVYGSVAALTVKMDN